MNKTLALIYMDTLDRIYLNEKSLQHAEVKKVYVADLALKEKLLEVISNRNDYDVYYKKDTLELMITKITSGSEKQDLFNRIEII